MPKTRIIEEDNTGGIQLLSGSNVVYIPGGSANSTLTGPGELKLYKTKKEFVKDFDNYEDDKSRKMASRLLEFGLPVLYQAFPVLNATVTWAEGEYFTEIVDSRFTINGIKYILGPTSFSDESGVNNYDIIDGSAEFDIEGTDFTQTITFDYIGSKVKYTVKKISASGTINIPASVWTTLKDRNLYDIRFLTTGGYSMSVTTPSNMISCASYRGDCVALIDHEELTQYSVSTIRTEIENAVNVVYTEAEAGKNYTNALSFGAAFTPWFTDSWLDGDTQISTTFPASFGYLLAFATSVERNPLWKAIAGSYRGVIPGLESVSYKYSNAECEILGARGTQFEVQLDDEDDNVGIAINPIALENPYGYLIWGNRTLRDNDGTVKATSQLHSRILVTELNKVLYQAAKKYTFEQNTDVLWINFKSEVNPLLEQMKSGEGIGEYRWKKIASNKRARLNARLLITPIDSIEDFDLVISMEDSIDVEE